MKESAFHNKFVREPLMEIVGIICGVLLIWLFFNVVV